MAAAQAEKAAKPLGTESAKKTHRSKRVPPAQRLWRTTKRSLRRGRPRAKGGGFRRERITNRRRRTRWPVARRSRVISRPPVNRNRARGSILRRAQTNRVARAARIARRPRASRLLVSRQRAIRRRAIRCRGGSLDVAQSSSSQRMRLKVDQWAGSFSGQQRRKLEVAIAPKLAALDEALAKAERTSQGVLDADQPGSGVAGRTRSRDFQRRAGDRERSEADRRAANRRRRIRPTRSSGCRCRTSESRTSNRRGSASGRR